MSLTKAPEIELVIFKVSQELAEFLLAALEQEHALV